MRIFILGAGLLALTGQAALAATVAAIDVDARHVREGVVQAESTVTGPPPGAISTSVDGVGGASGDFSGPPTATAGQNVLGLSGARVDAVFFGGAGRNEITAQSRLTLDTVNDTGQTQAYAFNFFLSQLSVELLDFAGVGDEPNPFADPTSDAIGGLIDFEILVDGATRFKSTTQVFGGIQALTVETGGVDGVTPDGQVIPAALVRTDPGVDRTATFDTFITSLDVGDYAPGQQFTLEAILTAQVIAPGFETGGRVTVFDPNDLTPPAGFTPGLTATPVGGPPVGVIPLPATAWLLLGGIGAMGAMRARRGA